MGYDSNLFTTFLLVATLCVLLPQASAFGAGDIPDFAYLNDKAFRHGDIESILETLAKTAGRASIGGSGLFGMAASVISAASGPAKFNKSDIKKVYFGNWLRDYSQAMDIAGLTKLSSDTLVLIVSILGFMTFGFSTEEFEVTADRLGVYLPVEHIDNPKGYAEKEGDARQFHPKLRPPVSDRELEFDENTGMKNYMATENQGWDTSTAFIRRTFQACIEAGRSARGREGAELWEAYRLLGTGLHTMEDLLAHSNWCEIALRKMGHSEVFCHVGDQVIIETPTGPAPPLVTGTFGGADFLHSLLGEAGDKLSQASVTDLSNKMNQAQGQNPNLGALKTILSKFMGGGDADAKLNEGEQMQQAAQGYHFNPDNICPPEVQQRLLELLKWHDDVMRQILRKLEMVPGLTNLIDEFSNALNAYIYTILAPYVTPILTQTTQVLDEGSKAVIDNHDQYEVFDNENASDPSHSLLSKDHFGLILNEPAGKIAQIVVEHGVNLIVQAWSDDSSPDEVIDKILEAFHHPYYNTGHSAIQHKMFNEMEAWIGGLGPDEAQQTIQALTKESVRDHKNKRLGSEDQSYDEPGYASCGHGQHSTVSATPAYGAEYGSSTQDNTGYGRQDTYSSGGHQEEHGSGGRQDDTYGSRHQEGYGSSGQQSDNYGYGRQETTTGYGGQSEPSSGYGRAAAQTGYGRQSEVSSDYGGGAAQTGYGSGGRHQEAYGHTEITPSHGGRRRHDDDNEKPAYTSGGGYGGSQTAYGGSYGQDEIQPAHGGHRRRDEDEVKPTYGGGYGQHRGEDEVKHTYGGGYEGAQDSSYGGGYGTQRRGDDEVKPTHYGGGGYGQDAEPTYGGGYGGSHKRDDSNDKPKYGGGYGGRGGNDDSDEDRKKKKSHKHKSEDSGDGYKTTTYDQHASSGYAPHYGGAASYGGRRNDDDEVKGYGRQREHGQSGYAPAYGGSNETFGAEGLKISSDSDDESKKHKKHGREYY